MAFPSPLPASKQSMVSVNRIEMSCLDQGSDDRFDPLSIFPAFLHPLQVSRKLAGEYRCEHQIPSF